MPNQFSSTVQQHQALEKISDREIFHVRLDQFDGPFDLLVTLITRRQLDITHIALSEVTDEFLRYVQRNTFSEHVEDISDFLLVAATLLDIKIAQLLPQSQYTDREDVHALAARDLLFARLLEYRAFRDASAWFAQRYELEIQRHSRLGEDKKVSGDVQIDWKMSLERFHALALEFFSREKKAEPDIPVSHIHDSATTFEHISHIVTVLKEARRLTFRQLVENAQQKRDIVTRFMILLELYKRDAIIFDQITILGELVIQWVGHNWDEEQITALEVNI